MERKTAAIIIVVLAAVLILASLYFTGNLAFLYPAGKQPITATSLRIMGFRVVGGSISDHAGVIFLSNDNDFVNLLFQWNVTTVFMSYDAVMFGYDGVIYCYSW
jgi:hypothetical protein